MYQDWNRYGEIEGESSRFFMGCNAKTASAK